MWKPVTFAPFSRTVRVASEGLARRGDLHAHRYMDWESFVETVLGWGRALLMVVGAFLLITNLGTVLLLAVGFVMFQRLRA